VLVFGVAGAVVRRRGVAPPPDRWLGVAVCATVSGVFVAWAGANVPVESFGPGGWIEGIARGAVALVASIAGPASLAAGVPLPTFGQILGRRDEHPCAPLALVSGGALVALTVLALERALMLVFDPRYVDFPFAPLLAAAVPFLMLALWFRPQKGARPAAEKLAAGILAGSAVYIVINETVANWQALLFCAGLAMLALTLARARAAPG
jgi:glucan 1,3-beta-glucosidase